MTPAEFNFFQHWYPLIPLEDLDPKRPKGLTVLGLRLVIWKSGNSDNYQVFLDQCPHRLAPLSEGRVDEQTGHLMCSYHGWEFNSEGQCTKIPQAENPDLIIKNQNNFCAIAFPCRQEQDLLWVWLDQKSPELAEKTPLPLSPQLDASKGFVWSSYTRDLEYDWQTLVENVADPSHVPFSHHGIQGNRKLGQPIALEIVTSTPDLIQAQIHRGMKTTITFEPPCRLEYEIHLGSTEKQIGLITYCIPISPGKSRLVALFNRNFAQQLSRITPRWWEHIKVRNSVIDGDMILLSYQEKFLQQRQQQESWKTAYKMPTGADRLVIEFRKWFDQYCNGQLPWQVLGFSETESQNFIEDRQAILDRYHQHTQHCSSCKNALKTIQQFQLILLGYFAFSVAGVALLPDEFRLSVGIPLIGLAVLGLGVYSWLKFKLEPQFYYVDYIHAER